MKRTTLLIATFFTLIIITGCGGGKGGSNGNPVSQTGTLKVKVTMPTDLATSSVNTLSVSTIDSIRVTVTGSGISTPIVKTLTIDPATHTASADIEVPIGSRNVKVEALDKDSVVMYTGQTTVNITSGATTQADITLKPVNGSIELIIIIHDRPFGNWNGTIAFKDSSNLWFINPTDNKQVISGTMTSGEIRWSPNGQYLACSISDRANFLDQNGSAISTNATFDSQISWLPDSSGVLTGIYFDGIYLIKPDGNSARLYQTSDRTYSHCPVVSKDGQWVYWVYHYYGTMCDLQRAPASTFLAGQGGQETIWNAFSTSHDEAVQIEAVVDNKIVVAYGVGIWLIDPIVKKPLATKILGPANFIYGSMDGQYVASLSSGAIQIYQVSTFSVVNTITPPQNENFEVMCWSPDSKALAIATSAGVYIWQFNDQRFQPIFSRAQIQTKMSREYSLSISWTN